MSSNCTLFAHAKTMVRRKSLSYGAPGEIRTPDLLLRRQSLYPAELRARTRRQEHSYYINPHLGAPFLARAFCERGVGSAITIPPCACF